MYLHKVFAEPKGEASNCDVLSFRVVMYVCMYVYPQLAQCNSMLVHVYPQHLHNTILCLRVYVHHALCNACATMRPKCAPGDDCGLSGGRFTQQVPIASVVCLAAYIALTTALARYAKDKGAFITARQRVGQTCDTASMHTVTTSAQRCPS